MILAFAGVVGLWGIGFFSFDLVDVVFRKHFQGQGLSSQEIAGKLTFWKGITSLGPERRGIFRHLCLRPDHASHRAKTGVCDLVRAGRGCHGHDVLVPRSFWQIFVLIPIMGFCQLALFGGYAIYFPELFPTRLRSTGTSFCYNVGRLVAAAGGRRSRDC